MSWTSRDLPTPASPITVTIRRARSLTDGGEGVLEPAQLLLPADGAGHHALDAAGLRPVALPVGGDDDLGVDRAVDALQPQARDPAQPEPPATWRAVSAREEDGAGRAAACSRAARLAVSPTTRNSSPPARPGR